MLPIRTILHPTDFSKQSELAFRTACSLAKDHGAELHVLHVIPSPLIGYIEGPMPVVPPDVQTQLREKLNRLRPESGEVRVTHRLVEGAPVDEILHMAKEIGCDVIVLGTHGRSGVGRVLLGSVAEGVVRKAPCPVLTIKTPVPEPKSAAGKNLRKVEELKAVEPQKGPG
jgi:nucleotide-binding universal stress UspA family protein